MKRSFGVGSALVALLTLGACSPKPPIVPEMPPASIATAKPMALPVSDPVSANGAPIQSQVHAPQLALDVAPVSSAIAASKATKMFVRVRITGLPLNSVKRPPLNLTLVVDTSGSMDGTAIQRARDACSTLVDALSDGDALSVVTFGSESHVIVPATRIHSDEKAAAKAAIAKIVAEGTTDMAGGLQAGIVQASTFLANDAINRIVLVGDGVPNVPASVTAFTTQATRLHIPITTLGLGPDFDETLMTQIAQSSGGAFHFVDDASRVSAVFADELSKMQRLVARNAWVELQPGPGVVIDDVLGLTHSPTDRGMRFDIGDMSEGQIRDAIIEVTVTAHHDGSTVELLDAVSHYNVPAAEADLTGRKFASLTATADASRISDSRNVEVDHQVARVRVADSLVRAIALGRSGDIKGARLLLDATAKLAKDEAKRLDDTDLANKAKEALSIKKTVASLAPPPVRNVPMPPMPGRPMRQDVDDVKMPSPAAALELRSAHGEAMREIQSIQ